MPHMGEGSPTEERFPDWLTRTWDEFEGNFNDTDGGKRWLQRFCDPATSLLEVLGLLEVAFENGRNGNHEIIRLVLQLADYRLLERLFMSRHLPDHILQKSPNLKVQRKALEVFFVGYLAQRKNERGDTLAWPWHRSIDRTRARGPEYPTLPECTQLYRDIAGFLVSLIQDHRLGTDYEPIVRDFVTDSLLSRHDPDEMDPIAEAVDGAMNHLCFLALHFNQEGLLWRSIPASGPGSRFRREAICSWLDAMAREPARGSTRRPSLEQVYYDGTRAYGRLAHRAARTLVHYYLSTGEMRLQRHKPHARGPAPRD